MSILLMNTYSRALRHISIEDVKQKQQQKLIEQKIKEETLKKKKEKEYISSVMEEKKYDWRSELFPQETIEQEKVVVEEIKVKIPKKLKSNWRDELYQEETKKIENQKELDIEEEIIEVPEHLKSNWRKELSEGITSKDFEYLYGLSISEIQISSVIGGLNSTLAQDIVNASADATDYAFGPEFPGSYINSIGDNQINSQSKVDVLAFLDTSYGDVSGSSLSYRLTTGSEGFDAFPGPGSVVSKVNLESALGVSLPSGVPNGNLGGTPIEGSAIKRIFTDAKPGRRINFNWSFASSEDALGEGTVDDYAFVAIKGNVTKFVSVLTRGLQYAGQFVYTVQPEDIVDGKVEIGIGVMDVFDPYIQTVLNISNFGSLWAAGSLGDTTDAADLGMPVNAANPNKKKKNDEFNISKMEKDLGQISQTGLAPGAGIKFMQDLIKDGLGGNQVRTTVNGVGMVGTPSQVIQQIKLNFPGGV